MLHVNSIAKKFLILVDDLKNLTFDITLFTDVIKAWLIFIFWFFKMWLVILSYNVLNTKKYFILYNQLIYELKSYYKVLLQSYLLGTVNFQWKKMSNRWRDLRHLFASLIIFLESWMTKNSMFWLILCSCWGVGAFNFTLVHPSKN